MIRTGNRDGFAFIEIVMEVVSVTGIVTMLVAVGVQSSIVASHASESRMEAHFEALRGDLENLVAYQALHYADRASYAESTGDLDFETAEGVQVAIHTASEGWAATATHDALAPGQGCAIYFGDVPPPGVPAVPRAPAQVACSE